MAHSKQTTGWINQSRRDAIQTLMADWLDVEDLECTSQHAFDMANRS